MESNARSSEDPIIYFTLIDFLLQLLFFGLFLFAVMRFGGVEPGTVSVPMTPPEKEIFERLRPQLPFYQGMSFLVDADSQRDMLTALSRLRDAGLLDAFLKFATQNEASLDAIQACAADPRLCDQIIRQCSAYPHACERFVAADASGINAMMALGMPPCRPKGRPLFSVVAHGSGLVGEEGGYRIRSVYQAGIEELGALGVTLAAGQEIKKAEVQGFFAPLSRRTLECAHYIDYASESDSEAMRSILEEHFYLRKVLRP